MNITGVHKDQCKKVEKIQGEEDQSDPPEAGFDAQSVIRILEAGVEKSAQEIAGAVYDGRFGGRPEAQRDDVTVLCLKKDLASGGPY